MRIAIHYATKNGMSGTFGVAHRNNKTSDINPAYTISKGGYYSSRLNVNGGLNINLDNYYNMISTIHHEYLH